MARVELARHDHRRRRHGGAIARGDRPASRRPSRQIRQARAQDRRLHFVEPAVGAGLEVMVARRLAAVAQPLDPRRELGVARDHRAAVTERAEVLGRIEAGGAGNADRADRAGRRPWPAAPAPRPRRAPGCAATAIASNARMSAAWPYRCTGMMARVREVIAASAARGIERQPFRIDVGEHRARAGHHHRERRVRGRQRRRDHFVAGTDVERAQDQRDGIGAGADADRERRLAGGGELRLERLDLGSEHEPAARDHAIDRGLDGGGVGAGPQRVKRNVARHSGAGARGSSPGCA